jgi:hypothetical protein
MISFMCRILKSQTQKQRVGGHCQAVGEMGEIVQRAQSHRQDEYILETHCMEW